MTTAGCGAPQQGRPGEGEEAAVAGQTVIEGQVTAAGTGVGGAYVRLLDSAGEFTAEVVASPEGQFRFFARPGTWTVRTLSPRGYGQAEVLAEAGRVTTVALAVGAG